MDTIEKKILETIDANKETLISLGNYLFDHAERGFSEQNTAELIAGELKKLGLQPEEHLAGTGVRAALCPFSKTSSQASPTASGADGPSPINLALISELDGILCPSHPHATKEGMSHACGHHGQLMAMLGAAMALTDPEVAGALDGTVTFFAVPAEEFLSEDIRSGLRENGISTHSGGKAELLSRGEFDGIDLAMTSHAHMVPCDRDFLIGNSACTGFIGKTITLHGKAAHAAAAPHEGVNAMNAAALGLSALGMIRETFQEKDYIRVHPIIKEAGTAINVVPDTAVLDMMVRAGSLKAVAEVSEKVDRAFKGAAYSIGAEIEIQNTTGYLPVIERTADPVMLNAAELLGQDVTYTAITPGLENMGSTDVGDLTHLMPILNFTFGGFTGALHSKDFRVTDEEKFFVLPAKFMALTAYRLLKNKAEEAKNILDEFKPALTMEEYLDYIK